MLALSPIAGEVDAYARAAYPRCMELSIPVPPGVLALVGKTEAEFAAEARLLLAAKMFELGRLSSGQAATLAGMNRVDFLEALGSVGVSMIQTDIDDIRAELQRHR